MSDRRPGRPPGHAHGHRLASGLVEAPPRVQPPPRPGRHATPGGPRRRSRAILIGGSALVVAAGVGIGLAVTGGHNPSASLSSGATAPTDGPAALATASATGSPPPWASDSCPSQLSSWRSIGAGGQLQAVVTDVAIVSQAATPLDADLAHRTAPAAGVTALRSAAVSVRTATRAAGKNLIPACVSGAHQAEVAALAALGSAVTGFDNTLSAVGSGDDQAAHRNIQTAISAMQTGSAQMAKATADLSRYGTKRAGPQA